ncbi:caspase family protein [Streptomyces siamensis]|uniref:Peptidase C14 caspase domain-containing protein n=1 Tax=Streptomyces siamensis TaxID=1274986 RepID=A0ABP9J104_9ACTN
MREHHYAVVSGINRYVSLDDLHGPVNDAEAFHRWLIDPCGGDVPEENIIRVPASGDTDLIDAVSAQPTADRIFRDFVEINNRLIATLESSPESWEQSRLYGYLAGHGTAPGGTGCAVLMPSADELGLVNHVEVQLLADWYGRFGPFKEVVFFVDCCREELHLLPCGPPMLQAWRPDDLPSVVLGLAAERGQQALEPSAAADGQPLRGYFTTALLDGMRAAVDSAGRVTVPGLDDHVRRLVLRYSDRRQLASVRLQQGMPVIVRREEATEKYPIRVHFTDDVKDLVIRDDYEDLLIRADARSDTPWELSLPSGTYWVGPRDYAAGDPYCEFSVKGRGTDVHYPTGTTHD